MQVFREFTFEVPRGIPPYSSGCADTLHVDVVLCCCPDQPSSWFVSRTEIERRLRAMQTRFDHGDFNEMRGSATFLLEKVALSIWSWLNPEFSMLHRITVHRGGDPPSEACTVCELAAATTV